MWDVFGFVDKLAETWFHLIWYAFNWFHTYIVDIYLHACPSIFCGIDCLELNDIDAVETFKLSRIRTVIIPESACEGFFVKKQPLYYIFTPADLHLHTFTPADLHLHTFTPADLHLHTFTSVDLHLHTFTPADLHLHTFTPADLHLHTLTSADLHLHTFTPADLPSGKLT